VHGTVAPTLPVGLAALLGARGQPATSRLRYRSTQATRGFSPSTSATAGVVQGAQPVFSYPRLQLLALSRAQAARWRLTDWLQVPIGT
jgi:hypothetical protein